MAYEKIMVAVDEGKCIVCIRTEKSLAFGGTQHGLVDKTRAPKTVGRFFQDSYVDPLPREG